MSLPPFGLFFSDGTKSGGEVVLLILLYPLLEVFIRCLIHKIKQVYLNRHSWLGIGKTCYNKAISLPFCVVMTEEWGIEGRGSNPGRCFLWWCEVSGEWFNAWQGWHIRCRQTSKGHALQRIHSWNHKVQVRLFLNEQTNSSEYLSYIRKQTNNYTFVIGQLYYIGILCRLTIWLGFSSIDKLRQTNK